MISFLKGLFSKPEVLSLRVTKTGAAVGRDLQIGVAAVLLELSGRDDDYAPEEVGTILRTLTAQFEIEKEAMLEIVTLADRDRKNKEQLSECIRNINDSYNDSQKITILSLLWQVLIADGKVDKAESRYIEQMRNRLRLTEAQLEQGKLQAITKK